MRLCQRTTRKVVLTGPGAALLERCAEIMGKVDEAIGHVGALGAGPRLCVNDPLTIHRMVVNGAGLGVISAYLCAPASRGGTTRWTAVLRKPAPSARPEPKPGRN